MRVEACAADPSFASRSMRAILVTRCPALLQADAFERAGERIDDCWGRRRIVQRQRRGPIFSTGRTVCRCTVRVLRFSASTNKASLSARINVAGRQRRFRDIVFGIRS